MSTARDSMINQAQQERLARDTKIMQKVNAAHREGFKTRFPGQCEHMMRLITERLQSVLAAKPSDLTKPATWDTTPTEIADLAEALWHLTVISQMYPTEESNEPNKE
jgi:hypothetical protein